MKNISLKRNESFSIRDGWIEKALNAITLENKNIFQGNEGMHHLGIGSNMVKSLKYWLQAANIIEKKTVGRIELTNFGQLLLKYDNYLEDIFSWQLIHVFLTSDFESNPIFNITFNDYRTSFTKKELVDVVIEKIGNKDYKFNPNFVESDVAVFLKTYYNDEKDAIPENNFTSPLATFKFLSKKSDKFKKEKPSIKLVNCLVIYFQLMQIYSDKNSFNIEESMNITNSPMKLFCLDKNMYLYYLDELKNEKLITINKTAGINAVYFDEKLSLEKIFQKYFNTEE